MTPSLPRDHKLDIRSLSRLFRNTTTSYKHLFFIGLLNCLIQRMETGDQSRVFSLRTIVQELLAFGWYPHRFFGLSYGPMDQVGRILDELEFELDDQAATLPRSGTRLRKAIEGQFDAIKAGDLQRYVPFRLQTPFFESELKGLSDHQKSERIAELAAGRFSTSNPPLYRIRTGEESIELHDAWSSYLEDNLAIVRGWALNAWAEYLQRRNPNTPAILKKIAPPEKREPLTRQRSIWKSVLEEQTFKCIYSGNPVDPDNFQLDHLIPWSFLCHDQLWNLIPAVPNANSAKGRSLPNAPQIDAFIQAQQKALHIQSRVLSSQKWLGICEEYSAGLSIPTEKILNPDILQKAYEQTLSPLVSLARQMGF